MISYNDYMRRIILVAHDIRSTHNVGSLLRTADGLGVEMVYLSGYTPYPSHAGDTRLPHLSRKIHDQIHKTALGAEATQAWQHTESLQHTLSTLRTEGFVIVGLEQSDGSIPLPKYSPPEKIAVLLGNEVAGIDPQIIQQLDKVIEIPMFGTKESFNVTIAASMLLYHLRFF